jgi:hypothetical protein
MAVCVEISIGSKAVIVAVGDRVGGGFSKVGIPAIRGSRAFVEWASFDCDPARRDELTGTLRGWFGKWLESLRKSLASLPSGFQPEDATMLD